MTIPMVWVKLIINLSMVLRCGAGPIVKMVILLIFKFTLENLWTTKEDETSFQSESSISESCLDEVHKQSRY